MRREPILRMVKRLPLPKGVRAITLPPYGILMEWSVRDEGDEFFQRVRAHELVHWEQYLRLGGAVRFYLVYVFMWLRHGYKDHPMEIEAKERSGVG